MMMTIEFPHFQAKSGLPTGQLKEIIRFYEEVGLKRIGSFSGHEGYSGVMFYAAYAISFRIHRRNRLVSSGARSARRQPACLYIPDQQEVIRISTKLKQMGYEEKEPENPYWEEKA